MKPLINFSLSLIKNILIIIIYYKSYLISLHTTTFAFLVQDIVFQLQRLVSALARYHNDCHGILKEADVFPIEVCSSKRPTRGNRLLVKFDVCLPFCKRKYSTVTIEKMM